MKPVLWFRITAVIMLLFGVMHTIGFLTFRPPSAEGQAVWRSMNDVSFTVDGGSYSYGHFYMAFGLSITAAQLFGAFVAWTLGTMAKRGAAGVKSIAWAIIAWQVVGIAIAAILVSATPAIISGLTVVLVLVALFSMRKVQASTV